MIPSKMFQDLKNGFAKDKSSPPVSSNKSTIIPNVCGFRKRVSSSSTISSTITSRDCRPTEGCHEIHITDKISGKYILPKRMNIKLQKPEQFSAPAFREENIYQSLDETINKTTKFKDFITKLNDDQHARQDLGCTPIEDVFIDQVGKCYDFSRSCIVQVMYHTHTNSHTHTWNKIALRMVARPELVC